MAYICRLNNKVYFMMKYKTLTLKFKNVEHYLKH